MQIWFCSGMFEKEKVALPSFPVFLIALLPDSVFLLIPFKLIKNCLPKIIDYTVLSRCMLLRGSQRYSSNSFWWSNQEASGACFSCWGACFKCKLLPNEIPSKFQPIKIYLKGSCLKAKTILPHTPKTVARNFPGQKSSSLSNKIFKVMRSCYLFCPNWWNLWTAPICSQKLRWHVQHHLKRDKAGSVCSGVSFLLLAL